MNIKVHLIVLVLLSIFLTGCIVRGNTPISMKIEKSNSVKDKEITFNLPKVDKISGNTLEFNFNDFYSNKTNTKINLGFAVLTENFNQYDLTHQITKLSRYDKYKKTSGKYIIIYSGLEVGYEKNALMLNYEYGERSQSARYTDTTDIKYLLKYQQVNHNTIKFIYPHEYVYLPTKTILGTSVPQMDTFENIEKDFQSIYNNLDKIVITMDIVYNLKGDVNSEYSNNSIYSNFDRILGKFNWNSKDVKSTSLKKENTFSFEYKTKKYPLHIEVFPYRKGSKVVYSLGLDYTVNSNNEYSLSAEDVIAMKSNIENIVND